MEIWRTEYAQQILTILLGVFNDIDPDDLDFAHTDDMDDLDSTIGSDWAEVRNNSSVNLSLNDTANLSDIGMAMHVLGQSDDEHINISGILSAFAEDFLQCPHRGYGHQHVTVIFCTAAIFRIWFIYD